MGLTDLYRHGCIGVNGELLEVCRTAAEGMWCRISPLGDVAWIDPLTDTCWLNGMVMNPRKTFALAPLAFDDVGRLWVYHADDVNTLSVYDFDGDYQRRVPIRPGTSGIVSVTDGIVVMGDDEPNFRRVVDGKLWACCVETEHYIVGGYGNDQYPGALAKYDKRTGQVQHWLGYTPVPHSALEYNGVLRVYINGTPNSPEPDQLVWVDALPEPVQTWPTLPPPPTSMPPMWIGGCAPPEVYVPGNMTWGPGYQVDARPYTEGAAYPHPSFAHRELLMGLWLSDRNNPPETVQAEIDYARANSAHAVYLHCDADDQWFYVREAGDRVRAAGLLPIYGDHVNHGEAVIVPNVDGAWGVTINIRTHGKDPARLFSGVTRAIETAAEKGATDVLIFGWEASCDPLRDYLTAVCSVTPQPASKPGQPAPTPPVETPPVTTPGTTTPSPKRDYVGLGAAIASVVMLFKPWKWFKRKKK